MADLRFCQLVDQKGRVSHCRPTIGVQCHHRSTIDEEGEHGNDGVLPNNQVSHPNQGWVCKGKLDHRMTGENNVHFRIGVVLLQSDVVWIEKHKDDLPRLVNKVFIDKIARTM